MPWKQINGDDVWVDEGDGPMPESGPALPTYAPVTNFEQLAKTASGARESGIPYGGQYGPTPTPTSSFAVPPVTGNPYVDINQRNAGETQKQIDDRFTSQVQPALSGIPGAQVASEQWNRGALETLKYGGDQYGTQLDAILAGQRNNTQGANAFGGNIVGGLGASYAGLNQSDLGALSNYQSQISPYYTPLQAGGYSDYNSNPGDVANQLAGLNMSLGAANGSLDYQAAQYASNPADVQRQQDMFGQFGNIAGGSLDYQSQGAQAYADPRTVQGQWDAYGGLNSVAQGGLDQISRASTTSASPGSIQQHQQAVGDLGRLVHGGEWADAQRDVRDRYKALSSPEITDQERFINEQFRQQSEGLERSNREATMSDLGRRGLRSGSAELTGTALTRQQLGNERVLSDLGASANAVGRSMTALAGYGQASQAGRQAELQAQGMYTDASGALRSQEFDEAFNKALAGDNMAVANANRRLTAQGMAADQINAMRQASFSEAYARGVAADNASANNQTTRLGGAIAQGNQANAIRAANDAVGTFNTGQVNLAQANNQTTRLGGINSYNNQSNAIRTSNDAVGTFNKEQSMIQQRQQEDYRQQEAIRIAGLASTELGNVQGINEGIGTRNQNLADTALGENNTQWNRTTSDNNTAAGVAGQKYGVVQDFTKSATDFGNKLFTDQLAAAGGQIAGQNSFVTGKATGAGMVSDALKDSAAEDYTSDALKLLGTGADKSSFNFWEDAFPVFDAVDPFKVGKKAKNLTG